MLDKVRQKFKKSPKNKTESKALSNKDYAQLGKDLEMVFTAGYANKSRLFWMSLLKGIGYGLGIFIGGTIVVAIVLSLSTRFEKLPFIGPFVEKWNYTIQNTQPAPKLQTPQEQE